MSDSMQKSTDTCAGFAKCPIYSGVLKGKDFTTAAYRQRYCDAGAKGWNVCKRFLVKAQGVPVPADLLPNSLHTVEQIVARQRAQAL